MPLENKKQLLIIVGAVAAGIIAVVLTANYIKKSTQEQTAALEEQYDAKQRELASQLQQRSDQQMAALAQELERTKREQAEAMQRQMLAMQEVAREAQAAARAQPQQLAQEIKKAPTSLSLKIPPGKRAVTVTIDSLAAVGGLINAGDFVDVIAQLNVPAQDTDKKTVTAMIFQNLQVLAVNTNIEQPGSYQEQQSSGSLKVTFAVGPQEAGLLDFADKNGTLELALRSKGENKHQKVKADTWKTLADYVMKNQGFDIENPDEAPVSTSKPEETKPTIQIFRRGQEL